MSALLTACPVAVNAPPTRSCAQMEAYGNVWRQKSTAGLLYRVWEQPDSSTAETTSQQEARGLPSPVIAIIITTAEYSVGLEVELILKMALHLEPFVYH